MKGPPMSRLTKLRGKLRKRQDSLKHHSIEFDRHHKKGRKVRAAWHRARIKADKRAIAKLKKLIRKEVERLEDLRPKSGTGAWGGSESIITNEITPFIEKRTGVTRTSGKREETYGNPGSDHHTSQTTASAGDYPLVNDYATAGALYAHLTGNAASSWGGDYSNFYIERAGKTFRVQLIAGTHGTGPHLHAGVRS